MLKYIEKHEKYAKNTPIFLIPPDKGWPAPTEMMIGGFYNHEKNLFLP